MDRSPHRGLAFLLSLGTLPIACKVDDKNETDGGTSTTGTGDGPGTTGAPTTTAGGSDGDATATGSDATGTETGSDATSGETGAAGDICETYATRYLECMPRADMAMILMYCQNTLEMLSYYGPACGMAAEDYYVCLTGLSCPDLPSAKGCEAEEEQIATICDLG